MRHEVPMHLALALNIILLLIGMVGSIVVAQTGPHLPAQRGPAVSGRRLVTHGDQRLGRDGGAGDSDGTGQYRHRPAYQIGETSIIGAFDYTYLIFAIAWGALLFNEVINGRTAAGLALILISGFILLKKPTATR